MSLPVWCAEASARFWAAAGDPPPFPRDLRPAIAGAVPVSVLDLPDLSVDSVRDWFARRGKPVSIDESDRPLQACLVAWRGMGYVFLDAGDDPAEQRFSLAHELAHFLRDYWFPRAAAMDRLGKAVATVLDGGRPATPEERVHAVLRNVRVGPFAHLLRRDATGRPLSPAEREAETAADRLAYELLAPVAALGGCGDRAELIARLVETFGFPSGPAGQYAALLIPARGRGIASHFCRGPGICSGGPPRWPS
jgi:hypothetical protein